MAIWLISFLSSFIFSRIIFRWLSVISLLTPPILQTEKMTRPPVVSSKISSTISLMRQACMKRLSNPMASAARPNQRRWLWSRESSCHRVRRQLARSGISMFMRPSTALA